MAQQHQSRGRYFLLTYYQQDCLSHRDMAQFPSLLLPVMRTGSMIYQNPHSKTYFPILSLSKSRMP